MSDIDQRNAMISAIEQVEADVVEEMVALTYRNPFWQARYGERSTRHTRKDGGYNLQHLRTAIAVGTPGSFADYYRWLRGLLVFRGMCTLHLRDNLDLTARLLADRLPDLWPQIEIYYQAAYQGLDYQNPSSKALEMISGSIARIVAARMFAAQPPDLAAFAACQRDNRFHLSYLADALEAQSASLFDEYIIFLSRFMPSVGVPLDSLQKALRLLAEEIYFSMPRELSEPVMQTLETARILVPTYRTP